MKYLLIEQATPVLNTPDFKYAFGGQSGCELPRNEHGHPKHNEFVALPGMTFEIVNAKSEYIIEVKCPRYSNDSIYIDRRFGREVNEPKPNNSRFASDEILNKMEEWVGAPYVWGGNWREGIPELLTLYPPRLKLDKTVETLWTFSGLDCSGLLFQATNGATPRNSTQLLKYGKALKISHLNINEIIKAVIPLDMIVYPGHVLFVRDKDTIIESKSPFGVRIFPIYQRLMELRSDRIFVDEWLPSTNSQNSMMIRRLI